jgi:hypothetical protein
LLSAVAAFAAPAQDVLDRVAVVVGNTVITETEVIQEARLEAFLNQASPDLTPDARRAAADRLVNQQLVRNEMQVGAYPEPTDAEVDNALRSFRQEHFNSLPAFRASLQKYGITEDQLKKHLRWQLAAIRFTDLRFSPAIPGIPADQSANRPSSDLPATSKVSDRSEHQVTPVDQSANRAAVPPPAGNADDQFEAWLKQARANTKIQFKPGAFQ